MLDKPIPAPNSIPKYSRFPFAIASSIAWLTSMAPHWSGEATQRVRRYPAGQSIEETSKGRRNPSCSKEMVATLLCESSASHDANFVEVFTSPPSIEIRIFNATSLRAGNRKCDGEPLKKSQQSGRPDVSSRQSELEATPDLREARRSTRPLQHESHRSMATSKSSPPCQQGISSCG